MKDRTVINSEKRAAALVVPMPNTAASLPDAQILLFATAVTHLSPALPNAWAGKYISITPIGCGVWFHVTVGATQEIDQGVAGAADGNGDDPTLGKYIASGTEKHYQLPELKLGETMYLNFEADAVATLEVALSSN